MAKKKIYRAKVILENRKGKKFKPGDKITPGDFPESVLRRWYSWDRIGDWAEEESDGSDSSDG